ncbi:MAG: polysaccharide biosynthesis tyrosine autokinase [Anaerolineae bacterium]
MIDTDPQRSKILAEEITRQLIAQSPSGTDPQKEADRQFVATQIEDLKSNIKQASDEMRQLDDTIAKATSARQIQEARTRQDSLRSQISSWQTTFAQLQTLLQQGTTNFISVVESAREGFQVGSGTMTNVLVAAGIGLVLASAAAFLLEYLDDTLKTPDDVRQLIDLTTLGNIAPIDGDSYNSKLITVRHPRSPITEAYRVLRTNLQFSTVDNPLKTLMVASPGPAEGKSLTTSNLAVVMAQTGKRVILVDADLRRPVQDQIFSLPNKVGLTNILLDPNLRLDDVLQASGVENLRVITSGQIPPNPAEILSSKRMGYLIEALHQESDIVIFDCPPLIPVTDGIVLSARLDGVLLVIDSGRTRRIYAKRSKEMLDTVGARVLGVTLNRMSIHGEGHYYHYYSAEDGEEHAATKPLATPVRTFEQLSSSLSSRLRRQGRPNGKTSQTDAALNAATSTRKTKPRNNV